MADNIIAAGVSEVTDATWESDVLGADMPVFVDFWAPWCGPCKMVAPVVEQLAEEYAGKVKFVKLNTDENQQVAMGYQIRSIPTLAIFNGGEPVQAMMGAAPLGHMKQFVDDSLSKISSEE